MTELEAAIGQMAETVAEIAVDRAGIDRERRERLGREVVIVRAKREIDPLVVEHALEHPGVAVARHGLELSRK